MKNLFVVLVSSFLILAGCTEDNVQTESTQLAREQRFQAHFDFLKAEFGKARNISQNHSINSRASCNKVPVCHNGNYIVVNKSAVPAHLAHGDQLTRCGNACIDGAEILQSGGPITYYYDTQVNDCLGFITDGFTESVIIEYENAEYYTSGVAAESYSYNGITYYYIYKYDNSGPGITCLTLNPTQAEYDCVIDYLRSYISANSCIPNFCDLYF